MKKHGAFAFLMGVMLCWVHIGSEVVVNGAFNRPIVGEKTVDRTGASTWWNGNLQSDLEAAARDRLPLFPFALRLRNQIQFELLNKLHGSKAELGPNGWLWKSGFSKRSNRLEAIEQTLDQWALLADWMAAEGKFLFFVLNANKYHAFTRGEISEVIGICPERLTQEGKTFDALMKEAFEARDLPAFVVGPWLEAVHDTSHVPMWPKNGIHCSVASAELIVDSAMRALSDLWSMPLPRRVSFGGTWDAQARHADNDIEKSCNLMWKLPDDSLWYPAFDWDFSDAPQTSLPRTMRIGDSFGNHLHEYGGFAAAFHPSSRRFHYAREEIAYAPHFKTSERMGTKVTPELLQRELRASDGLIVEYSESTFLRHSDLFFNKISPLLREARQLSASDTSGAFATPSSTPHFRK